MGLCHPAAAPTTGLSASQPDSPAVGGSKAAGRAGGKTNHLGEMQNHPITLWWIVCPTGPHSAKGSSTISPQPVAHKPRDLFLPPLSSAESNTDIWACTCLLSQALSEWGCHTSSLMLPKRETLTVIQKGNQGDIFLLQQLFPTLTQKDKIVPTFPSL